MKKTLIILSAIISLGMVAESEAKYRGGGGFRSSPRISSPSRVAPKPPRVQQPKAPVKAKPSVPLVTKPKKKVDIDIELPSAAGGASSGWFWGILIWMGLANAVEADEDETSN